MTQSLEAIDTGDEPRSQLWASTMQGHSDDGIIRAHSSIISYVTYDGPGNNVFSHSPLFDIEARCEAERAFMSPSATFSSSYGNRKRTEVGQSGSGIAADARTCFERDRDRILHSQEFRRLAGKTQVHLNPDDHQRTRLTHALEVAQISKAIARMLRLNETLAEAIALGHDCGHGPGGHASEDALAPFLPEGFNHATFGADVMLRRLNLCAETLDGIRNHSWSLDTPMTPEAEVVSFADRIAYVCHDAEDALSCGLISVNEFPSDLRSFLKLSRGTQIDYFINAIASATLSSSCIAMTGEAGATLAAFRAFNLEYIYQHDVAIEQNKSVVALLRSLVEYYIYHFESLPMRYRQGVGEVAQDQVRAVIEYVAGMTDQYAFAQHKKFVL